MLKVHSIHNAQHDTQCILAFQMINESLRVFVWPQSLPASNDTSTGDANFPLKSPSSHRPCNGSDCGAGIGLAPIITNSEDLSSAHDGDLGQSESKLVIRTVRQYVSFGLLEHLADVFVSQSVVVHLHILSRYLRSPHLRPVTLTGFA